MLSHTGHTGCMLDDACEEDYFMPHSTQYPPQTQQQQREGLQRNRGRSRSRSLGRANSASSVGAQGALGALGAALATHTPPRGLSMQLSHVSLSRSLSTSTTTDVNTEKTEKMNTGMQQNTVGAALTPPRGRLSRTLSTSTTTDVNIGMQQNMGLIGKHMCIMCIKPSLSMLQIHIKPIYIYCTCVLNPPPTPTNTY
jgi:hypothetical protein